MRSSKLFSIIIAVALSITLATVSLSCNKKGKILSSDNNTVKQDSTNNQSYPKNNQGMMNGGMMGKGMMGGDMMGNRMNSNNSSNTNSKNGWTAPPFSRELVNPIKNIVEASKLGGKLYNQQCVTCHGKDAKGDGPTGVLLNPKPANLISQKVQVQSDGEIFWKISNGSPPMPGFKNSLSNKQRWELVEYIRSLKKN